MDNSISESTLRKTRSKNSKFNTDRGTTTSLDYRITLDSVTNNSEFESEFRERPERTFCTKSKYSGCWDELGMNYSGQYKLFYGVTYEGEICDGMFHGTGTMTYPSTSVVHGNWENGRLKSYQYRFSDKKFHGPYCNEDDRRFYLEIKEGLRPRGKHLLTNSYEARKIPLGCYDTTDGFYNPKTKCVVSASDPNIIIRIPTNSEHEWIINNCRKWEEYVNQPELPNSSLKIDKTLDGESTEDVSEEDGDMESKKSC